MLPAFHMWAKMYTKLTHQTSDSSIESCGCPPLMTFDEMCSPFYAECIDKSEFVTCLKYLSIYYCKFCLKIALPLTILISKISKITKNMFTG